MRRCDDVTLRSWCCLGVQAGYAATRVAWRAAKPLLTEAQRQAVLNKAGSTAFKMGTVAIVGTAVIITVPRFVRKGGAAQEHNGLGRWGSQGVFLQDEVVVDRFRDPKVDGVDICESQPSA